MTMPAHSWNYWPLPQLILARLRTFYREPGAVFWVYGFPLLMVAVLGIAFRTNPAQKVTVDVQAGPGAARRRDARAGQPIYRLSRSRPVGDEPDGRRIEGRRVRDCRHADPQAAQALRGN